MSRIEASDAAVRSLRGALPGSAKLHARATAALAGAATHDSWRFEPFAPAYASAQGPYKRDVDGRDYVDLWMGHGSLILGHGDPEITAAALEQARLGTHLAGLTPVMIAWAEAICDLVPSAHKVRFTASGSEAAHLSFRVARAWTGRDVILRLGGHYHGWHENLLAGVADPASIGQVDEAAIEVFGHDAYDEIVQRLAKGDVAAVLLEPGGGGSGALDSAEAGLKRLREACDQHQTLLIFDEVISGFRYAPGGVQGLVGIMPDLTVLAKIMAGGWPGGALVGRDAPMSVFGAGTQSGERVIHAGTFNGFAPSAAAGAATLRRIADGQAQQAADKAARLLVDGVNEAAWARGVDVGMFAHSSTVHLVFGAQAAGVSLAPSMDAFRLIMGQGVSHAALRRYLLVEGLDMHATHGWVSAAHDEAAITRAVGAFDRAFIAWRESQARPSPVTPCVERCLEPACAVRKRVLAGCDLPLANKAD